MASIRRLFFRFLSLFNGHRQDRELDSELQFCLDMETDENIRQGMSPDEARREAILKIGGIEQVKENCRDQRGLPWLESFLRDILYGVRQLFRNPGISILIILLVTLGVGASTAIFSVVKAVLINPLPYESPEKLTFLWQADAMYSGAPFSGLDFLDFREQSKSFEYLTAFEPNYLNLSGSGDPERVQGTMVTNGLFELLRVQPVMGRTFTPEDLLPGNSRVAIISHSLWQRRFGSDPEMIGKPIIINEESCSIVGVMPPGFSHPCPWSVGSKTEVWKPFSLSAFTERPRTSQWLMVMGRLREGVSIRASGEEMMSISRSLGEQYPDIWGEKWVNVYPMQEYMVGRVSGGILILQGASWIILLIVCINIAGLLLARATTRHTEIAIRAALGAGQIRLMRQIIMENLPLALAGGCLGILLASWSINVFKRIIPTNIPRVDEIQIDGSILVFAIGTALLTGLVFSLAPALVTNNTNLCEALKLGRGIRQAGTGILRFRNMLIILQLALAIMLANGAVLMLQSYNQLKNQDHGFSTENVLTARLNLQGYRYGSEEQMQSFYAELLPNIMALPGVEGAAAVSRLPLEGGANSRIIPEGREESDARLLTEIKSATTGYFKAMGISILSGRDFLPQDSAPAQPGVIVNQRLAELCWPGENPLGKRFRFGDGVWLTAVGVVKNTRQHGAERQPFPEAYFPYVSPPVSRLSSFTRVKYLVINCVDNPFSLVGPIRAEVSRLDPNQPLSEIRTTGQILAQSLARRNFNTALIVLFASLALVLVAAGIYGTMSYHVARRTHEIGIRMALGASPSAILKNVLKRGLSQVLTGIAFGLLLVLASSRILGSMVYGISPVHPLTFIAVSGFMTVISITACLVPARRAARVNPLESLRIE